MTDLIKKLNSSEFVVADRVADGLIDEYLEGKYFEEKFNLKRIKNKLSYGQGGKPYLDLVPSEKILIKMDDQGQHDLLMQVFESGGWQTISELIPTMLDPFRVYPAFYVSAEEKFNWGRKENFVSPSFLKEISDEDFYKIQGVTQKMREEIYSWYETNKPNRASKGVLF